MTNVEIVNNMDVIYFDFENYEIKDVKEGKGVQIEYNYNRGTKRITKRRTKMAVNRIANNPMIIGRNMEELSEYLSLIGECQYVFRKGVGYVGEVYMLKYGGKHKDKYTFFLFEKQNKRLKESYRSLELEEKELEFIYPLVRAPDLTNKGFVWSKHYIIFPYYPNSKEPISEEEFERIAPNLYKHLFRHKDKIQKQSSYNDRIQKRKEFYSLIRVGEYTYGKHFVALRDNTRINACYVGLIDTDWGIKKQPIFDGHVSYVRVSSKKEAKYIVDILRNPKVEELINILHDNRSISLRLPIKIAKLGSGG
ncbi:MAG: hypothetical protein QXO21_01210 [Candidatus Anstonellales archaeon]